VTIAAFALLYFLCATLGNLLSSTGTSYVSFWPPGGLYLGALLLSERRRWWVWMLGAAIGNLAFDGWHGTALPVSIGFYVANSLNATIGAWVVQRFVAARPTMASLGEFFGVLLLGGVGGAAAGATFGAATLFAGGLNPNYVLAWKGWWGGTAMATLLITPIVLSWGGDPGASLRWLKRYRLLAEFALVCALIVLSIRLSGPGNEIRLLPLLVWSGVRFGVRGATAVALFVALALAFVTPSVATGLVPTFLGNHEVQYSMQLFLGVMNCVAVVPAIVLDQHALALARVREAEERQRTFASATFEGLCFTEGMCIVDVNDQMLAFLGQERSALLGSEFEALLMPESRAALREAESGGGNGQAFPLVLRKADGTALHVEAHMRELRLADRRARVIALRDLSESRRAENARRELEEQLRQSQKLEAIGTLAGGIAHDLNNHLMALLGYAEVGAIEGAAQEAVRDAFREVTHAGQRAAGLVRKILQFSRRQPQAVGEVNLTALTRETLVLLRSTLPSTVQLDADLGEQAMFVRGDAPQLQQVLVNLCTNASHAMHNQPGTLRVRLRPLPAEAGESGEFVELSVRDEGEGMSDEVRSRIFEPFFTTKSPAEGTGLGLAVVHGIVRDHAGRILVESERGAGTTMRVRLPALDPVTPARSAPESVSEPAVQALRILLVDDEEPVCRVMALQLTRRGHQVTTFTDPAGAWSTFESNPGAFDLVVTDLTMPTMTGLDLASRVRTLSGEMPILMITGNPTALEPEAVTALRIHAVLHKPIDSSELLAAIGAAAGRRHLTA
jgi:PAS domain S-box-containing protein